ncbi:hypothetical protein D3C76_926620 [compost metagenome]
MQADDLRFGQQLRQAQVASAEGFDLRVGVGVIGQQPAAKSAHDFGEGGTNLTGADHADGLAHQIETGQPLQSEIPFASAVVGAGQAAVECEDQRYCMFGNGVGRIGRDTHDGQSQAFCCRQVDMVVTGRAQGDQACASSGQALEYRSAKVIIDERADRFIPLGERYRVEAQARSLKLQLDAGWLPGREKAVAVVVLAAEKNRTHAVLLEGGLRR